MDHLQRETLQLDAVRFNCSECLAGRPEEALYVAPAACKCCLIMQRQSAKLRRRPLKNAAGASESTSCLTRHLTRCLQVLTRALQLHVSEPGLWSYAAAWEFEHNGNAAAARMLMQRGLRMRPDSQQLWLEYFKLELHYAQKLVARRKVLGIDSPAPAQPAAAVTAAAQQQAAVVGEGGSEAMSMEGAAAEQQPDTQAAVAADQDAAAEQLAAVQQQGVLEMDARQDPVSELIPGSQPGSEGPHLASAGAGPSAADEAVQAVLGGAIAKVGSLCCDLVSELRVLLVFPCRGSMFTRQFLYSSWQDLLPADGSALYSMPAQADRFQWGSPSTLL